MTLNPMLHRVAAFALLGPRLGVPLPQDVEGRRTDQFHPGGAGMRCSRGFLEKSLWWAGAERVRASVGALSGFAPRTRASASAILSALKICKFVVPTQVTPVQITLKMF